jgi:hypothetical protein
MKLQMRWVALGTAIAFVLFASLVARNTARLAALSIEIEGLGAAQAALESDIRSLRDWRALTQASRFTADDGAKMRAALDLQVLLLRARMKQAEERLREGAP